MRAEVPPASARDVRPAGREQLVRSALDLRTGRAVVDDAEGRRTGNVAHSGGKRCATEAAVDDVRRAEGLEQRGVLERCRGDYGREPGEARELNC